MQQKIRTPSNQKVRLLYEQFQVIKEKMSLTHKKPGEQISTLICPNTPLPPSLSHRDRTNACSSAPIQPPSITTLRYALTKSVSLFLDSQIQRIEQLVAERTMALQNRLIRVTDILTDRLGKMQDGKTPSLVSTRQSEEDVTQDGNRKIRKLRQEVEQQSKVIGGLYKKIREMNNEYQLTLAQNKEVIKSIKKQLQEKKAVRARSSGNKLIKGMCQSLESQAELYAEENKYLKSKATRLSKLVATNEIDQSRFETQNELLRKEMRLQNGKGQLLEGILGGVVTAIAKEGRNKGILGSVIEKVMLLADSKVKRLIISLHAVV